MPLPVGYKHNPEARAKMSAARMGKQNSLGYRHTAEARAKIRMTGLGRRHTPEARARISAAKRGHVTTAETRAKIAMTKKGTRLSMEHREKIRQNNRMKLPEVREKHRLACNRPERIEKLRLAQLGRRATEETRKKMSLSQGRGEKNHSWKGGPSDGRHRWETWATVAWRLAVYARDDYTCQDCMKRGGMLNAHHIESWVKNSELRFDVNNGLTLCLSCHKNRHRKR